MGFPGLGFQELHFGTHQEAAWFMCQVGMDLHLSSVVALISEILQAIVFADVGQNVNNFSEVQITSCAQMGYYLLENAKGFLIFVTILFVLDLF